MAHQEDPESSIAPYPSPPSYLWKEFTHDNYTRIQHFHNTSEFEASQQTHSITSNIPKELEYLTPPPPPPDGKWRLFGQLHDLSDRLPSLEDHGIERLGPMIPSTSAEKDAHANKVFELKKLSKSLLLNFLELAGILSTNPNNATEKLADLQTIFYNMHQQVNEWRPHQTREALISLLQGQLEKTRNETRALQEVTDSVRRTLVGFAGVQYPNSAIDDFDTQPKLNGSNGADNPLYRSSHARSGELWQTLDDIFG